MFTHFSIDIKSVFQKRLNILFDFMFKNCNFRIETQFYLQLFGILLQF